MTHTLPVLFGFFGLLSIQLAVAQPGITRFNYHRLPDLPMQEGKQNPGVAGAFAGVSHGALLVAGGANFPNSYPWQNGTKVWHDAVYVLTKRNTEWRWHSAATLSTPLAYGASVNWNGQLIGIGGNDASGRYADVFTLTWDAKANRVKTGTLPKLPLALANHSAAVLDDVLYVFGGESNRGTEKSLFALNLKNPAAGWQKRAELPDRARAFLALVAQAGALYVLGGRETIAGKTTVFSDAWAYQPTQNNWSLLPELPTPVAAHTAAAVGKNAILIWGGDDGVRLGEIERENRQIAALPNGDEKTRLTTSRNALQSDHPGFRREVWQFRTDTQTWSVADTLPFATPVTTTVVRWNNHLVLPSGEVSPGIRTPAIWQIDPSKPH